MVTACLSDYLEIIKVPEGAEMRTQVQVEGHWVRLKVELSQWPKALRDQWQSELFFLFTGSGRIGRLDAKDRMMLCHEVTNCPKKLAGQEDRGCGHYNQGICVAGTAVANDLRPLSFGTIGVFHGISKQRVQQIYCAAQKKVVRAAARDPVLREYYTALGLRPENLPDPEELARQMESSLRR